MGAANVSATGANQVTVTATLTFPSIMLGQLSVQAWGTDQLGLAGPPTEVTKFTVTGTPMPTILMTGGGVFEVAPGVEATGQQAVLLLNGAQGPVSVSAPTSSYCGLHSGFAAPSASQVSSSQATITMIADVQGGDTLCYAGFNVSVPGLAPAADSLSFLVSSSSFYTVSTPEAVYTATQGTTLPVPVTFTPQLGFNSSLIPTAGTNGGMQGTWSVNSLSLNGAASTATLNLAISPGLASGTYAVSVVESGYDYTFYVTVLAGMRRWISRSARSLR